MKKYASYIYKFTLLELLIVIAVLAILASILAPLSIKILNQSKRTINYSNLKQIYMAMSMYEQENNGFMPYLSSENVGSQNLFLLLPYIGYSLEILYPKVMFDEDKNDEEDSLGYYLQHKSQLIPDVKSGNTSLLPGYAYCSVDNNGNPLIMSQTNLTDDDSDSHIVSPIVTTINRTYTDEAYLLLSDGTVERIKGSEANDSIIE